MREKIIEHYSIITLIDTRGTNAHPDVFDANAGWVISVGKTNGFLSSFYKLNQKIGSKDGALETAISNPTCGWFYRADASTFHDIPGTPIAYWASEAVRSAFLKGKRLVSVIEARQGLTTGNNSIFVRNWYEVAIGKSTLSGNVLGKWFPCDKGGDYRKWYGNNYCVIDWEYNGRRLRQYPGSTLRNSSFYLKESYSWSDVSSSVIATRNKPSGFIFEHCSDSLFGDHDVISYLGAYLNSSTATAFLSILAPTLKFEVGQIRSLPVFFGQERPIVELAERNAELSKTDWDSQETSWDFKRHFLV